MPHALVKTNGVHCLCLLLLVRSTAVKLERYNVDPSTVTVSGFSSGAAMAMQFHIAFSQHLYGAAIFAGLPYACGKPGVNYSTAICMTNPASVDTQVLVKEIEALAFTSAIDSPSNLNGTPVFIFHGILDSMIHLESGSRVEEIYNHYGSNVETQFEIQAEHGFPTDSYGPPCSWNSESMHFINNCNYNGASIALQHLYSCEFLQSPVPWPWGVGELALAGDFLEFEQGEFLEDCSTADCSMDSHGFLYVPSGCRTNRKNETSTCKLHITFHGCTQSRWMIGELYARETGYLEVAELNNIIVLFPQTAPSHQQNPYSCWDWWAFLDQQFLTKQGGQMKAVFKMLTRLVDLRS